MQGRTPSELIDLEDRLSVLSSPQFLRSPADMHHPSVTAFGPPGPSSADAHDSTDSISIGPSTSMTTVSTVRPQATRIRLGTRRESYLAWLRDRYPAFEPQNDYEVVSIVESDYSGSASELREAMDKQLLLDIMGAAGLDSLEAVAGMDVAAAARITEGFLWQAKSILDAPVAVSEQCAWVGTLEAY